MTSTVVNDRKGQVKHEIDVVALDKRAGRVARRRGDVLLVDLAAVAGCGDPVVVPGVTGGV
ncbi:hypothetical protein ABZ907_14355 [Nonomuraea wenchangensis]